MINKSFAKNWAIVVLVFLLAVTPKQLASAQKSDPPGPQGINSIDLGIRPVEVRLNPAYSSFYQAPPPPRSGLSRVRLSASFAIDYVANGATNYFGDVCSTFPEVAKVPFEYSASIWASQLNSAIPVRIQACWSDMATGILGHAGAVTYYRDFANAPRAGTWYPIALANLYSGTDRNGATPEISIAYNSDYLNTFYYGTDASTPGDKINFATVVLHEITHGLGFSGFMSYSGGSGSWGIATGYPASYDRFTVDGSGNLLINTAFYPNPSTQLGTILTSNSVYFNGANSRAANGGSNAKLYAPSTWASGSSYSHLDYSTYAGTNNRLMIYSVSYGETNYSPGPVTMGILTDIGWPYPPTDITLSNANVTAGLPVGTTVGALSSTEPNSPEFFTYSLVAGGADNASFSINSNNLLTNTIFVSEGSKSIRVRSTDRNGLSFDRDFTIFVLPSVNHPPTDMSLSANSVAENMPINTTIGALTTTDPDAGNTFLYSFVNTGPCPGTDNASFNIINGSLQTNASFNFEAKSSYTICVRSTDQGGLTFDKGFTISITNLNEAPTGINLSISNVAENTPSNTTVGVITSSDPDTGNTFAYSLVNSAPCPGTDNALFNISGSTLRTSASFNFEAKSSYTICVRTTDQGALVFDKAFTITVMNVNEPPTNIDLSANTISENQVIDTTVGTLNTIDPDAGNTFTYSLTSTSACPGTDNASFNISGSTLRTSASFNFEAKASYVICIRTADQGALSFNKVFTVAITNVNEAPTDINLSTNSVAENQPANTTVGTLVTNDPDAGNTFTYSLASSIACPGTDNDVFNISGSTLRTSAVFNFRAKSSYAICVRSTDQGLLAIDKVFTIAVSEISQAPTHINLSANSIAENQAINEAIGMFALPLTRILGTHSIILLSARVFVLALITMPSPSRTARCYPPNPSIMR